MTDAGELTRWFPMQARVKPGKGGSILYSWGAGIEGDCGIEIWEPGRHLRTGWMEPAPGGVGMDAAAAAVGGTAALLKEQEQARRQLAVDWSLEGKGGKTVLRLVHSGFSHAPEWDTEYDGTRRGWDFELQSLRHYLENHRGKNRQAIWIRQPVQAPAAEVWAALTGPGKLLKEGRLEGLGAGDRYALTRASGDRLEGVVQINTPPTDFAGTTANLDNGLFRMGYEDFFQPAEAVMWLSTWGLPAAEVAALRGRWQTLLAGLFA
jgi:uncharacterized protein YndB with AHSA1/START domain